MDATTYKFWLSIIAMMLTVAAFLPYILSILRGQIRPHIFSWLIWGLNTSVAFFAAIQTGGGIGSWVIGFSALVTWLIAALAYANRADVIATPADRWFFFAALAAMPLWVWLNDPLWAIWLVTIIELLGFGPTLRKTWFKPYSESLVFSSLLVVRNILVIAALERYTTTTVLFPAAMTVACLALVAMMVWRRRMTTIANASLQI